MFYFISKQTISGLNIIKWYGTLYYIYSDLKPETVE